MTEYWEMTSEEARAEDHDGDEPRPCDYCGETHPSVHVDFEKGILCDGCEEDLVQIETRPCPDCKKALLLWVRASDLKAHKNGVYVQDAFPYLSSGTRERFISGLCPVCWNDLLGGIEE